MPFARHTAMFNEQAEILVTMDIGQMWDRYLGEFLGQWEQFNRQGLPVDEIERRMQTFLDDLSDKPIEDLARQTAGVAYNEGRAAEALSAYTSGEARWAVRSEILDESTCQACYDLDTATREIGTPEEKELRPPAYCFGGRRCRGFDVYLSDKYARAVA